LNKKLLNGFLSFQNLHQEVHIIKIAQNNSFPRGKVDFCHRQKDGRVAAPLQVLTALVIAETSTLQSPSVTASLKGSN